MFKASQTQQQKPLLGAYLNRSHPLARDLLFYLPVFNESWKTKDFTGNVPLHSSLAPAGNPSYSGGSLLFNGTSSDIVYRGKNPGGNARYSIQVIIKFNA